ncbi:helix-turn-helix domain-containing protein [Natronomonas gomsonensis]|jgi:DNA-binding MarR family transcriptional regulator|uniref:helix-turn-helix transcriptional regulator n=1 Tax=Natronomonas gomsonensis TaxID=1046043 RepID=UPI0020CA8F58|nr:helix-turn-helix domain-containing protein [Natronomonas gomsonensis]MCY4732383.1 helix-turn-helix domain-containing protein [Natronomonas gomsonensis]
MSDAESVVKDLPPSAKLVYKTLEYEGPMTQSQLAEESLLPQRTVRHALRKLEDADIVDESVYLMDARKSTYAVRTGEEPDTATPAA